MFKVRLREKKLDLIPVGQAPFAAEAWRITEESTARLSRFRINDIILIADPSGTK